MNTLRFKQTRRLQAMAVLAAALALAGCGGRSGGDGGSSVSFVPGTGVPTAATTSVAGAFAFLMDLIGMTSETSDPVVVGDAVLSTSETDDATPLQ